MVNQEVIKTIARKAGAISLIGLLLAAAGGVSAEDPVLGLPPPAPQEGVAVPASHPANGFPDTHGEVFKAPLCTYVDQSRTSIEVHPKDGGLPYVKLVMQTHTRSSLAVGLNDFGSIGVGEVPGPAGFQMPIGYAHENLAVGAWVEGWAVRHGPTGGTGTTASHTPHRGPAGTITQIDDAYTDSDRYVVYRVTLDLGSAASPLRTDYEWTLDREDCDLTLRTTFHNQGPGAVDVRYKRIVDWDNLDSQGLGTGTSTPGFFQAEWTEDGRTATATRYTATGIPHYACRTSTVGVDIPDHIDLYGWDDYTSATGVGAWDFTGSYTGDGNAAFHFNRDSLPSGASWDVVLRYSCDHLAVGDALVASHTVS